MRYHQAAGHEREREHHPERLDRDAEHVHFGLHRHRSSSRVIVSRTLRIRPAARRRRSGIYGAVSHVCDNASYG